MALKALMLKRSIDRKMEELEAFRAKDAEFSTREAELEQAIGEAETPEQEQAVGEAVEQFDAEKKEHESKKEALSREIDGLEAELAALEEAEPKLDERGKEPKEKRERMNPMKLETNIRSLPLSRRAFDALSIEQRTEIVEQPEVKEFLHQLRSMKGQSRAVTGAELTIPVFFLDLIAENMFR